MSHGLLLGNKFNQLFNSCNSTFVLMLKVAPIEAQIIAANPNHWIPFLRP